MEKTIHDSWLSFWEITSKRMPGDLKKYVEKYAQGAFYAGAFTVVSDKKFTKQQIWKMCESGMSDACGKPGMRLADEEGKPFQG